MAEVQLVFAEEWARDRVGASAGELAAWKKGVGFSETFVEVVERKDGAGNALRIAPEGGSAPLISRDQFSVSGKMEVELVFSREAPSGTWLRLSLLSAETPEAGYFLQIYRNSLELVRAGEGEVPESVSRKQLPGGEMVPGEMLKVRLKVGAPGGKVEVLLNDEPFLLLDESAPALPGEGNVRLGVRCQSEVSVVIESVKLFTEVIL